MPFFILRSANRAGYEAYEPQSICAWATEANLAEAPLESWEELETEEALVAALQAAPAFAPPYVEPPAQEPPAPPSAASLVKAAIASAMEFGKQLMIEYGSTNVLAQRTPEQVAAISDKLATVQARLLSGSLYAALLAIDAIEPDSLVTIETKAEFKAKIEAYLGINQEEEQ